MSLANLTARLAEVEQEIEDLSGTSHTERKAGLYDELAKLQKAIQMNQSPIEVEVRGLT